MLVALVVAAYAADQTSPLAMACAALLACVAALLERHSKPRLR